MTVRRGALWLVAGLALALLAGRWLAGHYAEWAFFHALGGDAVWRAQLLTRATLRAGVLLGAFAFAFANFFAVRQSIVSLVLPRQVGNLEIPEAIPTRRLTLLALGGAAALAVLFALVDHDWTTASLAFGGVPFGELEPYFERDLGFFVYWLPFEHLLFSISAVLLLLTSGIVLALYASTPSVRWDDRGFYVSAWVRRHLGVLGALAILLIGWDWRLDRFGLLSAGALEDGFVLAPRPFGPFDHRILVPYLGFLVFASAPVAAVLAWSMWRGYLRLALGLVTLVVLGGPVARVSLPLLTPGERGNQADAERRNRPYAATGVLYTRRAYGVDLIVRPESSTVHRLTVPQAARWVSAWDPAALTRFLERERRGTDVAGLSWQMGRDGVEAVLVRGAPPGSPPGSRWPVDRLLASQVDSRGFPVTPVGAAAQGVNSVLVRPGATRYALLPDSLGRIAAPRFASTLERIALSWDQQNPRLLASEPPLPRPKLMTLRDVRERVTTFAPFLRAGASVTPIVRADSLYWVIELFTTARHYPLSERLTFDGTAARYVHHAATAVLQAQTGEVMLLPVDAPDPMMRTWMRRFPQLFTARARAPRWLDDVLPPATDWLLVQGAMLARTGFLGDTTALRALARVDDADADLATGTFTLFQADSTGRSAWSIPVMGSDNEIEGLLTAHGGLSPRTQFTREAPAMSWTAVLERLQAAADQAGFGRALPDSRRGRVQSIPTERGAAFFQSFYEWPADGPPRLTGVAVLLAGRTMVGPSLAEALGFRDAQPSATSVPAEAFRARVAALYDAMDVALRAGDWRAYGDAWAALGRLLARPTP